MKNAKEAAEDIKRFGKSLKGFMALAEVLDGIVSIEDHIGELETREALLIESNKDAELALNKKQDGIQVAGEQAQNLFNEAKAQAEKLKSDARADAQSILQEAQASSIQLKAILSKEAEDMRAAIRDSEAILGGLKEQAQAEQATLSNIRAAIERLTKN